MSDDAARFWAKVNLLAPVPSARPDLGACWLWVGADNGNGYGRFTLGRKSRPYAHRFAYELLIGPVSDRLDMDHLCRVTQCVNPHHLEPVTHRVNVLRGTSPVAENLAKDHCVNGHPFDTANTYFRANGRRDCRACARDRVARQRNTGERVAVRPTEAIPA